MERKVILYLAMSLDGFIADKNGGVGWMDLANNGEAFEGDTVHPRRTQTPFLRPRTRQRRYAA